MDQPSLYDTDILTWSAQQADELRRLAAGADVSNTLDLPNIIEEIEALGRSDLKSVNSLLRRIFEHLVKCAVEPTALSLAHWRREVRVWHGDLADMYTPSMRQHVTLDHLWHRAVQQAEEALRHRNTRLPPMPAHCPIALKDLVQDPFDLDAAIARIQAAAGLRGP